MGGASASQPLPDWAGGQVGRYRKLLKEWKVLSLVRRKPHRDIIAAVKYPETCLRQIESRDFLSMFPCPGDTEHHWINELKTLGHCDDEGAHH